MVNLIKLDEDREEIDGGKANSEPVKSEKTTEAVKFTDIMNKNKVSPETLIDIYNNGIDMDLKSEAVESQIMIGKKVEVSLRLFDIFERNRVFISL